MYKTISKTAYKQTFNPEPLRRCWKECLEKSSFHARKLAAEEFNKKNYWKKRGLAVVPMKFTVGLPMAFYNQVRLGETSSCQKLFSTRLAIWKSRSCATRHGPLRGEKELGPFPGAGNKVASVTHWGPQVSGQPWCDTVPRTSESSQQIESSSGGSGLAEGPKPGFRVRGQVSDPRANWRKQEDPFLSFLIS